MDDHQQSSNVNQATLYRRLALSAFALVAVGTVAFQWLEDDWSWVDSFYFSVVAVTTVGFGDVYPVGPIRFMTGMEALTGLVMITWSASFTFLEMQRDWPAGRKPLKFCGDNYGYLVRGLQENTSVGHYFTGSHSNGGA